MGMHCVSCPVHLIGHSRVVSLMCGNQPLCLGTNGVWVDHLTTLDPHPRMIRIFHWISFFIRRTMRLAATYQNILFHDNYWQNNSTLISGEPVSRCVMCAS